MIPFLFRIFHLLLFGGGVSYCIDFIDFWLTKDAKIRIQKNVIAARNSVEITEPVTLVQRPLRMLSRLFDEICGEKILSMKSFLRISTVTGCLLVSTLAFVGFLNGRPFGIDIYPWETFDLYFSVFKKVETSPDFKKIEDPYLNAPLVYVRQHELHRLKEKTNIPVSPTPSSASQPTPKGIPSPTPWIPQTAAQAVNASQIAHAILADLSALNSYDNPVMRFIYSLMFFAFIPILIITLDFACIAIARKILREMIVAKTLTTLFALFLLNSIIFIFAFLIALIFMCFASYPFGMAIVAGIAAIAWFGSSALGWFGSFGLASTLLLPCILSALWFAPAWVKVASFNAALPTFLLFTISSAALIAFPFRQNLHKALVYLLSLASEHEKGAIQFAKVALGFLVALIALISQY